MSVDMKKREISEWVCVCIGENNRGRRRLEKRETLLDAGSIEIPSSHLAYRTERDQ